MKAQKLLACHSEHSEESSDFTSGVMPLSRWILHFVQNDKNSAISRCLSVLCVEN
jgi:hypothetical protein